MPLKRLAEITPCGIIGMHSQRRYEGHMNDNQNDTHIIKRRGPDQKLWYVVAHASDMTTASIPAGLLRSAEIPVYLFREAVGSAIPVTVGKMGGVDVAVPEAYYAEAMALLESDADDLPGDLLAPPEADNPDDES